MAYECCLRDGEAEFTVVDMGRELIVSALIGIDRTLGRTYFIKAALSPYDEGVREYSFWVVERDVETGEEEEHWSGRSVWFIPRESREDVLIVIMAATKCLLDIARPEQVYRCTHDAYPPDEALDKHHKIGQVFHRCGYSVTRCDDWHGKRAWIATLTESD